MASEWYFAKNGTRHGPVSSSGLKELAKEGRLSPGDLVWREGLTEWQPASKVKGLFPELPTPSTSPLAAPTPPQPPQMPQLPPDQPASGGAALAVHFRSKWAKWSLGGKIMFVSACVAVASSTFMKWSDVGVIRWNGYSPQTILMDVTGFIGVSVNNRDFLHAVDHNVLSHDAARETLATLAHGSRNGLSQGAYFYLAFIVYPMWRLIADRPIDPYFGIGSAVGGMLISAVYMGGRFYSSEECWLLLFGAGPMYFLLASGALAYGVHMCQRTR